ncbi:MAG TPA: Xaa-Pro peptidase family protein [Candidatus Acidoferrum sp.]|nr:Xaa-Pro peptidase family protein [Candidatus Acidoferrum sp.]
MTRSVRLKTCFLMALLFSPMTQAGQAGKRPEKLSPAFHKNRLEELYRRCPDGLILLRGEVSWYRKREMRAFDAAYADYNFKQERNLYYLTGIEVPDSFVLIDPKKKEVRLYTEWKGARELEEVRKLDYVSGPYPPEAFLHDVLVRSPDYAALYALYVPFLEAGNLYGKTGPLTGVFPPGLGEPLSEETQFARRLAETFPNLRVKSLAPALLEMQRIKQEEEIGLLRRANEIAAHGVVEAIKAIRPGLYDHDINAVIEYVFTRGGGVNPTFALNVMSGPNAFLDLLPLWSDYDHLDRQMKAGEAVFLDVGAEVAYYVSDIGRTAPVSGKFTAEQKKLYDVYLPCFLKAERSIRPGVTQRDLMKICASCAREQLSHLEEGFLRKAVEEFIREVESHATLGHYQDLNVMGAGAGNDEPLQPGMVFAIEPVLYSKELNFAVFVEDVILVTADGYDVLSKGMPYTTDEIEKLMAQKSIIEASEERH